MTHKAPQEFWHFTCADHGYRGLGKRGFLRPNAHPLIPELGPVIWVTTEAVPARDSVGLTSALTSCDRMEYRYSVHPAPSIFAWETVRHLAPASALTALESFGEPETWYLSKLPLLATLDAVAVAA